MSPFVHHVACLDLVLFLLLATVRSSRHDLRFFARWCLQCDDRRHRTPGIKVHTRIGSQNMGSLSGKLIKVQSQVSCRSLSFHYCRSHTLHSSFSSSPLESLPSLSTVRPLIDCLAPSSGVSLATAEAGSTESVLSVESKDTVQLEDNLVRLNVYGLTKVTHVL